MDMKCAHLFVVRQSAIHGIERRLCLLLTSRFR